jgi:hypothetical protein
MALICLWACWRNTFSCVNMFSGALLIVIINVEGYDERRVSCSHVLPSFCESLYVIFGFVMR